MTANSNRKKPPMPERSRNAGPRVESAAEVLQRLDKQASELDWAGDHRAADLKRTEAQRIRDRGDLWVPNF